LHGPKSRVAAKRIEDRLDVQEDQIPAPFGERAVEFGKRGIQSA
jgi:hypothetical protein